jgi:N,N'-diacetyllegionaminate synthase
MEPVRIGSREIGPGRSCFAVAEVGINHNGSLDRALEMIKVAKRAGADAVKFQTFKAEEFIADASQTFTYRSQGKLVTESMLEMFRRHELREDDWRAIRQRCDEEEILFLSTPQNRTDLELLLDLGISAIKVGSDDLTNLPLVRSYATAGLPLILSCGMSDLGEVYRALEAAGSLDGHPTVLLVCTSQYPTPLVDANLLRIKTLADVFPMVPIGFSDHTQGPLAASLAVALGACLFEKHFTLDHDLPGPDHWFSEDPEGLALWVDSIRAAQVALGSGMVRPTPSELLHKREYQRAVVAVRPIRKGEEYSVDNLGMRRVVGGGLPPAFLDLLVGKVSSRDYASGEAVSL